MTLLQVYQKNDVDPEDDYQDTPYDSDTIPMIKLMNCGIDAQCQGITNVYNQARYYARHGTLFVPKKNDEASKAIVTRRKAYS